MIVGEASRGEDRYAASVRKLAQDYQLSNVIFTGYRSDTVDVLSAIDIFVFPSHAEAFGIALAEAMAMGKPSVCARADGVIDIAVDGVTSLMFEKKNGEDLVEKLQPLIRNRDLRKRLGTAARARIMERFDIEILTDAVINIYHEALRGAR
jgi:glycosyltransferase involved in cell wall biosynthesis